VEFRLFDAFNSDFTSTSHSSRATRRASGPAVRLHRVRRTAIPGSRDHISFHAGFARHRCPNPRLPFWKAVTPTAAVGTEGSLLVSILFLADSTTKTYGPIQVLVH